MSSAVIVSLRVKTKPLRAFKVFTEEIGTWWQPSDLFQLTPRGDGTLKFEPGENGRLVTVLPDGREFEIGRILVWLPGEQLTVSWRQVTMPPDMATEVDVKFEAIGDETRVTVEHRGWSRVPQEHVARHGFPLAIFQRRAGEHWQSLLRSFAKNADQ